MPVVSISEERIIQSPPPIMPPPVRSMPECQSIATFSARLVPAGFVSPVIREIRIEVTIISIDKSVKRKEFFFPSLSVKT